MDKHTAFEKNVLKIFRDWEYYDVITFPKNITSGWSVINYLNDTIETADILEQPRSLLIVKRRL